jgi:hypothetical protein
MRKTRRRAESQTLVAMAGLDRIGVFGSVREGVGWVRPCVYK